jgi:methionyl-tRNA formyltransferase
VRIIFFGTPDFAVPSLDILNNSEHEIVAVVTAPDKERGRGRKVSSTPIKEYAILNNLKCLQPEKMKDKLFVESLKELKADLFVIVAFKILPHSVFTIPKFGSFNLHGSLLPKYRGAAPIHWAIMNGDKKTGVTTFFLEDKVDTGNMIFQSELPIEDEDNLGTVHDKMRLLGADLVHKTVNAIDNGNYELQKQNNELASPAPKIQKELGEIDWNKSVEDIHNLVRGLSPFPSAYFIYNDKKYKIFKSKIKYDISLSVGELKETKFELYFGCSDSSLQILEIQLEGRKRMGVEEFLRGYSINNK